MRDIILFIIQLIFNKLVVGEYLFKDSSEVTYLEANFTNTFDHIFPWDLQITVYLTRMNGLLFYSIDKNLNQLIINLQDTKVPTMKIEFREEKYFIELINFCKCKFHSCLYEKLNFQFQIGDTIDIRCNQGIINKHNFNNKLFNSKYPIPTFYNNNNKSAYLWLINVPNYKNKDSTTVYPNPEYLTGCIFDVKYKREPVKLNVFGSAGRCTRQCTNKICNDGECLETFNSKPICNCGISFLNGEYCNKSLSETGTRDFDFQFKILKLSFTCNSTKKSVKLNVLDLTNGVKRIEIYLTKANTLILKYIQSTTEFTNEIMKNFCTNCKSLLIMEFKDKNIVIKLKVNQNWTNSNIYVNQDLSHVLFKISFLNSVKNNNTGAFGDVVYKLSENEIQWLPIKWGNAVKSKSERKEKLSGEFTTISSVNVESTVNDKITIVMIMMSAIDATVFISLLIYYYISKEQNCKSKNRFPKSSKSISKIFEIGVTSFKSLKTSIVLNSYM